MTRDQHLTAVGEVARSAKWCNVPLVEKTSGWIKMAMVKNATR